MNQTGVSVAVFAIVALLCSQRARRETGQPAGKCRRAQDRTSSQTPAGLGRGKVRRDLVEVQMFEQLEAGRAEDVGVLQDLHRVPATALGEQRQGSPRQGDQHGLLAGHQALHDAVLGIIGEAAGEHPVDVALHHRRHRQPPQGIDDGQDVGSADVVLGLGDVRADGVSGAGRRQLLPVRTGAEAHAIEVEGPLATPERFQFGGVRARHPHREAVFDGMGDDDEMLHDGLLSRRESHPRQVRGIDPSQVPGMARRVRPSASRPGGLGRLRRQSRRRQPLVLRGLAGHRPGGERTAGRKAAVDPSQHAHAVTQSDRHRIAALKPGQ